MLASIIKEFGRILCEYRHITPQSVVWKLIPSYDNTKNYTRSVRREHHTLHGIRQTDVDNWSVRETHDSVAK